MKEGCKKCPKRAEFVIEGVIYAIIFWTILVVIYGVVGGK